MALTATEITQVVAKLAPALIAGWIQKAYQPTSRTVVLEIRTPGHTHRLLLSVHPASTRIHLMTRALQNPPTPPAFCQYLRAHLHGARIDDLRQEGRDRIVALSLTTKAGPQRLIAELTGNRANLLVLDSEERVLRDLNRSTELYGVPYQLPTPPAGHEQHDHGVRFTSNSHDPLSLSSAIESYYDEKESTDGIAALRGSRAHQIRKTIKKQRRRVDAWQSDLAKAEKYRNYARYGELLKANLGTIKKGLESIVVVDYFDETLPQLTIPLDPTKSAQGNMDDYFRKQRKQATAERELLPRIAQGEAELDALRRELHAIEQGTWQPCPHMGTSSLQIDSLRISSALLACKGLQEFDRTLNQELLKALNSDFVSFYLYSETTQTFAPVSNLLITPDSPGHRIGQLPTEGTIKEAVIRQGRAILEHDLANSSWAETVVLKTTPFHTASVLAAPVTLLPQQEDQPARTLAIIATIAINRVHAFTEEDRAFLEQLGSRLGPVLHNLLASEERDALMAINSRVVVGTMTIEELMPVVNEVLHRVIRQDMTGLVRFVQTSQGPWFEIAYRDGVEIDLAQLRRFPFEQMAPAEMMASGKPLLMTGHNHTRFPERAYLESAGILSCMLCPLIVRGTPYGFLAIGNRRRNAFSERDLAFAEQIGFHLSQAIANLTAYEEIRSLKEQLEQENVYLRDEVTASIDFDQLVGESSALQQTLKAIEQVAPTDSTVLITGETGTGKELVAQAIHRLSPRKDKPLITVNCATLPPTLIESELFGHEKGAFTNATARKIGRFELANGGTIFLDEIGELPIDLQAKFLRVLETQELERVGGTHPLKLNNRVLAATNVNIEQAAKQGLFRSDLFYRLNVFPIRIPPLRDRRDDIAILARHFVKKYSARHRKTVTRIGSQTLKALGTYDWPGNVRELEHLIERAVIVSQGPVLLIDELDPPPNYTDGEKSPRTLADAERSHIMETLGQTNWVLAGKQGAAARLGMKRSTLQHRMKKLGITLPPRRKK
ncbi:hypothetical protein B566_EDAN000347 [Ephemera danica]|nr:hypothetical protein B566_EDAN000347 [Ephemera danica]